jgi:D-alanine-D-alanine ligase
MSNKKLNVAVIFGGRSGEHEVSLVSASSVIKNLDKNKYNIIQVGITKTGEWIAGQDALSFLKSNHGSRFKNQAISPDTFRNKIAGRRIDVIFPVLHGTYGEDGTIQGLFEMANIAYVGAGVLGSALAMDKITQKILCASESILVPDWVWFTKKEWQWTKKSRLVFTKWLKGVEERLSYPMFIKPSNLGSSVGISKAHNRDELIRAINLAARYDRRVLV